MRLDFIQSHEVGEGKHANEGQILSVTWGGGGTRLDFFIQIQSSALLENAFFCE